MFIYPQHTYIGGPEVREHVASVIENGHEYRIYYYGTWEEEGDAFIWACAADDDAVGERCFVPLHSVEDCVEDIIEWRYDPIDMDELAQAVDNIHASLGIGQPRH